MIRKSIFGEDHADVATSYSNLATRYSRLGKYNQAKELNEKALMILKKIFVKDHAHVATSCNNLATQSALRRRTRKARQKISVLFVE